MKKFQLSTSCLLAVVELTLCFNRVPKTEAFLSSPLTSQWNPYRDLCSAMPTTAARSASAKDFTTTLSALSKDKLLELTQEYLDNPSPDWWSDDFIFRGPVIGPLVKNDIIATLKSVGSDTSSAFPDMEWNIFGITADDPTEANRVWYFVRPRGTFLGKFNHPTVGVIEPTGAKYIAPPEVRSIIFNDDGKIKYQSVGYVADRFTGDTTGGRGAVFGQYAVMGQEIDATVGSVSTVLLQKLTGFLPEGMVPKSYSNVEDIPDWWTDKRMGAEA